jgi:hypothetical protein
VEPGLKNSTTKNWNDGAEAAMPEGRPRRSTRIAALPRKNYKV